MASSSGSPEPPSSDAKHPGGPLRTFGALVAWVNTVGFAPLLPKRGVPLLSAREAVLGRRYEGGKAWMGWDRTMEQLWQWKDRLGAERRGYYGEGLLPYPALIALRLLPAFLALSPSGGTTGGFRRLYEDGLLSRDATLIYEALRTHGPLSRVRLRAITGLPSVRLGRALKDLERTGLLARVGIAPQPSGWPATVYAPMEAAFPKAVARASSMGTSEARRAVLDRYFRAGGRPTQRELAQTFGWPAPVLQALVLPPGSTAARPDDASLQAD
jgi:hypothetical protein